MRDRSSHHDDVIRASEIGQYVYCARAWWLGRVRGYESAHVVEMAAGGEEHRAHGRRVVGYHRLQRAAYLLLMLAVLIGAAWLCSIGGLLR